LTAKGIPFSQMVKAITKYARIRGNSDQEWDYV
jgi:hypothetical protein